MQMIQENSPHLKDLLQCDETGEKNIILCLMVHFIGINQIMSLFTEKNAYFGNW